jgi:hypothetical protein
MPPGRGQMALEDPNDGDNRFGDQEDVGSDCNPYSERTAWALLPLLERWSSQHRNGVKRIQPWPTWQLQKPQRNKSLKGEVDTKQVDDGG